VNGYTPAEKYFAARNKTLLLSNHKHKGQSSRTNQNPKKNPKKNPKTTNQRSKGQ
jgi:hypothetical protein